MGQLRYLLQPSSSTYNTCSASHILLKGPKAHTSLGRLSFQFTAASDWNELQQTQTGQLYLNLFIQRLNHGPLLTVVAALRNVLLSLPSCALCCCLCPTMFVPCLFSAAYNYVVLLPCCVATMLLSCCVATMLCCHVLLPCYVVVLGLSLCSVVSLLL